MAEGFYDLYCEEVQKNERLTEEIKHLKISNLSLENRIKYIEENHDKIIEDKVSKQVDKVTRAFEDKVISLTIEVDHLKSVLNNDSTNSGLSTAKTSISKNKRIPNSRTASSKKKGGQLKHPKNKLLKFNDHEITDYIDHDKEVCDVCGSIMLKTGRIIEKDEYDIDIVVKKIRHRFYEMQCQECGMIYKEKIQVSLKEENQYGKGIQTLALSLMNEGYVSMSRTKEIISGLTQNKINLSEGYIAKLQKRLSKHVEEFIHEIKREVIKLDIVYWDDTVIDIATNRACLRFYGNENIALYTAHSHKDKEGLDEDKILLSLDKETVVMHDHNIINYNDDYDFTNVECCVHLLRDLKKVVDNLGHQWPKDMIDLLLRENHKRNNNEYIDPKYISMVYDQYVNEGEYENLCDTNKYYGDREKTLLRRLRKYKDNYLMWTYNEEIPFSNNISERSLRSSKTKMKVSGQFTNLNNAIYFANIKSYIETGHRHGMNSTLLIKRALEGNPVGIEEMREHAKDEL